MLRLTLVPILLLVACLPRLSAEVIDFPFGMDATWRTLSAAVSPDAFAPDRERPSVLVVSPSPPESFEHAVFSISWAPAPSAKSSFPPPQKRAYTSGQQYLWRWILMLGPDAVVTQHASLAKALAHQVPCFASIEEIPLSLEPSILRMELQSRATRTPTEIADAVSNHYGHQLDSISYIPALAMVGRSRLAQLHGDDLSAELIAIAEKAPVPRSLSGPAVSGHLIFAELGLKDRVLTAAKSGIANPGHNQMSDSVFMICPLLAAAGRLGDDPQFFNECVAHLQRMRKLCLRDDGLYRHSPLDEAAWGRGNGFPALGLAWSLSEMPESFAGRQDVLDAFQKHIGALAKHQDASGMWHQVIDHPESYREFTATCMITFAIIRGMRNGWLDKETYRPVADRGWSAVKQRISLDGKSFTDACTGTGKQKSLKDYFRRTAILGPDERSGAMALMVATERGLWEKASGE